MALNSLGFLMHECFLNIRRNGLMSFAALGTVTVALTVLGASLWTLYRINEYALQQPQRFNQIDVFLPVEAERPRAESLRDRLRQMPEVGQVRLITKEQAWAGMQQDEPALTQALTDNPLPDKIEIEVRQIAQVGALAERLRDKAQFPDIVKVVDASREVRTLLSLARVIKVIGGCVALGLFIATLFIVHNTIRLTVLARRHEIHIMQLVGATPGFIRLPLLLEGLFHGVAGALVAGGLVLLCGSEVSRFFLSLRSPLIGDIPTQVGPMQVLVGLVGIGALIGFSGSYLSVRRFLRQV
jgi:cell division transport system permease protein